jgi:hypothetical protein
MTIIVVSRDLLCVFRSKRKKKKKEKKKTEKSQQGRAARMASVNLNASASLNINELVNSIGVACSAVAQALARAVEDARARKKEEIFGKARAQFAKIQIEAKNLSDNLEFFNENVLPTLSEEQCSDVSFLFSKLKDSFQVAESLLEDYVDGVRGGGGYATESYLNELSGACVLTLALIHGTGLKDHCWAVRTGAFYVLSGRERGSNSLLEQLKAKSFFRRRPLHDGDQWEEVDYTDEDLAVILKNSIG